ncbi:MAG: permease-like cell division protein FtsX [Candidatus Berkelbacteria bacterium]|nr:permease-like cell division protein FtsX [Candidatus Berkelbacteria bacterium]
MNSTGFQNFTITSRRVLKSALVSAWRNRLLSLATTIVIILALFIISLFTFTTIVANQAAAVLKNKVDLTVYLKDSVSDDQVTALEDIIRSRSEVLSIKYLDKDAALAVWRTQHADNTDLQNVISETDNPLPRSFEVKTARPEQIETVANFLDSEDYAPLIAQIDYKQTKNIIDRLVRITSFIRIIGWSLSLLFVLISILIVYNTLRLAIYARSDEIEIMRLVGASGMYIRGPFIIEGLLYGFLAAIITAIIFYFFTGVTIGPVQNYLGLSEYSSSLSVNIWLIILLQFVVGLLLGAFCSLLAIRRYLSENRTK